MKEGHTEAVVINEAQHTSNRKANSWPQNEIHQKQYTQLKKKKKKYIPTGIEISRSTVGRVRRRKRRRRRGAQKWNTFAEGASLTLLMLLFIRYNLM